MKKKRCILLLLFSVYSLVCCTVKTNNNCIRCPTDPTSVWNTQKLDEAFQYACELGTSTLMVVTNGKIVKSMGDVDKPLQIHSMRKPILGALVGQHLGDGPNQINLGRTLAELGISDTPNPLTPLQQQASILDLMRSKSGINHSRWIFEAQEGASGVRCRFSGPYETGVFHPSPQGWVYGES